MVDENTDSHTLYETLLAGIGGGGPAKPPRASAAVVPWRQSGDTDSGAIEVYWVRRSPALRFMGGWHAFPGGGLSRRDAGIPLHGSPAGTTPDTVTPATCGTDDDLPPDLVPGLLVCALRELFEETGLLLVSANDGTLDDALPDPTLRQRLLDKEFGFSAVLEQHGGNLDASPLVFAGRWLTPPVAPMRFDNRFFLLEWPAARRAQPSIIPGELAEGEWIAPHRALERWRRGEVIVAPPIVHLLRALAEDGPEGALPRLRDTREACLGPIRRVEFRPGVILLPLLTPTLPPATHTNAFLLGGGEAVLVDPATPLAEEQERLLAALAAFAEDGGRVRAIWLTHHHRDHTGAVERVRRELGVPVLAHPASVAPLARQGIALDDTLADGHRVELAGDPPVTLRVLHTPGHTRGHLAFFEENTRSLIAGDLVSALSTIVVDPPDGDMDDYLASLAAMAELAPATLFPSHGPVILDAVGKLEEYRQHRLEREASILDAWDRGLTSAAAMVAEVYTDVPAIVHPIAMRQIEAHLIRLRRLGRLG